MGKEIKIGLGIIGALLCVFGGVLFMRLKKEQPLMAEAKAAVEKIEAKFKPTKKTDDDNVEKPKRRKPSLDAALAKAPGRAGNEQSTGPALDHYDRPIDDAQQSADATEASIDPPADLNEPPSIDKSPYRNRPRDDRYARYPTEQETPDEAEQPAAAGDEAAPTDDLGQSDNEVAMPADRFSPRGGGLTLSPPADEGEMPADEQAKPEATQSPNEQFADEQPADEPSPSGRYNDEQQMFPDRSADDRLADNNDASANEANEPAQVPQPADEEGYTVEPNDNFWRISQKLYGTGAYFKALEEYNRQRFGDQVVIHAGDVIAAPPLDVLRARFPELAPNGRTAPAARRPSRGRRSYTVADGDTLFDIARHELGKASRWSEIYELNRDQLGNDFNDLTPGMKLALPDAGSQADPVIGGSPRDRYRR